LKSDLLRQIRNLFKEDNIRLNKRFLIFFFFLLLSTTIWFLNALDKTYIAEISYPVIYYNFPSNRTETNDLPSYFTLRVEASGYFLLKQKTGNSVYPIQINISKYLPEIYLTDTSKFLIRTSSFLGAIESQLSEQVKIIEINPESINFMFAEKSAKIIKVYPKITYKLKRQFIEKNIKVVPSKIIVSGPINILDTLTQIPTILSNFENLSNSISQEIPLKSFKYLTYSTNKVFVTINIEKFTESSIDIPVILINKPDNISIQLNPKKIKLKFYVGLSNFKHVNRAQFRVVADYNEIIKNNTNKLSVVIKEFPAYVFNLNCNPLTVNYIKRSKK